MRLLRFGPKGAEKPGLLDAEGRIRDLSGQIDDITPDVLAPDSLRRLARLDPSSLPLASGSPRLGCPLAYVPNLVCIGLNYADHARETNSPIPAEPIVFMKHTGSIVGPNDQVSLPRGSVKGDWEVELGVVIGTRASYVDEADALDHVAGYCIVNDVSERDYQFRDPASSGSRARAPRPSPRSAPGWSPRTRSRTRRTSRCGPTSTTTAFRTARPAP
jgi:2-keto-4-pentenoate hydratase/2-oxohepta-3-ene-1,7-dioic acid hydratase in catechol pathway